MRHAAPPPPDFIDERMAAIAMVEAALRQDVPAMRALEPTDVTSLENMVTGLLRVASLLAQHGAAVMRVDPLQLLAGVRTYVHTEGDQ